MKMKTFRICTPGFEEQPWQAHCLLCYTRKYDFQASFNYFVL